MKKKYIILVATIILIMILSLLPLIENPFKENSSYEYKIIFSFAFILAILLFFWVFKYYFGIESIGTG
jgi:hypothetical protein